MKKIARYTPYENDSDFMAHLIEHCICHPFGQPKKLVAREFMSGSAGVDGDITYYTCDHFIPNTELIAYCKRSAFQKAKVQYEYEVFIEEFDNKDYKLRVYDKFIQKHIQKKRSSNPYRITQQELLAYSSQYYTQGNYIIYDTENGKISASSSPICVLEKTTFSAYKKNRLLTRTLI